MNVLQGDQREDGGEMMDGSSYDFRWTTNWTTLPVLTFNTVRVVYEWLDGSNSFENISWTYSDLSVLGTDWFRMVPLNPAHCGVIEKMIWPNKNTTTWNVVFHQARVQVKLSLKQFILQAVYATLSEIINHRRLKNKKQNKNKKQQRAGKSSELQNASKVNCSDSNGGEGHHVSLRLSYQRKMVHVPSLVLFSVSREHGKMEG